MKLFTKVNIYVCKYQKAVKILVFLLICVMEIRVGSANYYNGPAFDLSHYSDTFLTGDFCIEDINHLQ